MSRVEEISKRIPLPLLPSSMVIGLMTCSIEKVFVLRGVSVRVDWKMSWLGSSR